MTLIDYNNFSINNVDNDFMVLCHRGSSSLSARHETTVEVWDWTGYFTQHFMNVITYSSWE